MGDSADRRSEGKNTASPNVVAYKTKKARGICVVIGCGAPTHGRSYCYDCSDKQVSSTYKSGLRHFTKHAGIDPDQAVQMLAQLTAKIDRRRLNSQDRQLLAGLGILFTAGERL